MLSKVISYSFYLLFALVPLFWTSVNYELFEYNKMMLTYGFTVIITGAWLLKMLNEKQLLIKRTPLDIPLLLFLGANILSTIFSMDPHTSIWGYYSRLNGGLLSLIAYLLLYWAFVSNMDFNKVKTTLKFGLASGFLISLWAILEHFGVSFSCVILRGDFNATCWIQDVQSRVFATLGQPNWLAAYLAMLIFPAFYFFLTASSKNQRIAYYISLITSYLAFTFTYSRGPTLGLIGGMVVFLLGCLFCHPESAKGGRRIFHDLGGFFTSFRMTRVAGVLISFLVINLLFGSAITSFRLISKYAAPVRPGISIASTPASVGTQLENGGTESGQIRLIVWKGALDIFKNYPIFGSGLETFAYSYYQYRPASHNLTSEWDFLYNKAHNEYLNYLATTGLVGIGTYMLVILIFIFWSVKKFIGKQTKEKLLVISLLAAYISYLISNFFLFSVVIIAIFFYLFPALIFIATESAKPLKLPKIFNYPLSIVNLIYHRPFYIKSVKTIVILGTFYLLYSVFQLWYADTLFAKGENALSAGNAGAGYNLISSAAELNQGEPFYKSELGLAAAQGAASLAETDATLSADLKNIALIQTNQALKTSPKNVSFLRTAIRTYFALTLVDKSYFDKTLQTLDLAIKFAPTDPKLYYNKALILSSVDRKDEELKVLQQAIELKPNYQEAIAQLKEATKSSKTK
ncbi:O-antigen ligase family protein [Patescibacteria group bacterium]|nr:O-antigen ligase family protein [Patescibacteria group bacterium]